VNHGVSATTIADLYAAASAFFYLSADAKRQVARPRPDQSRGYNGDGEETLARLGGRQTPTRLQGNLLDRSVRSAERHLLCGAGGISLIRAPNLWPSRPPELQLAMRAYWQATGDAFVVNVGDILMRWTNDCWVSTPHRVANPPDGCERRLSIPYFFQANYDTVVERLRQGETPKYPSVTVGAYRAERFAKTAG
jgi:isopenicillin N synthase-like dioxygenase